MSRLISQSQFARRTKYSRARISQLVKQGVIMLVDGKVDPDQASVGIRSNVFRPQRLGSLSKKLVCDEEGERIVANNTDQKIENLRIQIEELKLRILALEKLSKPEP